MAMPRRTTSDIYRGNAEAVGQDVATRRRDIYANNASAVGQKTAEGAALASPQPDTGMQRRSTPPPIAQPTPLAAPMESTPFPTFEPQASLISDPVDSVATGMQRKRRGTINSRSIFGDDSGL